MSGTVAVTGASGFIGRALVARLRSQGRDVIELGRRELAGGDGPLQRSLAGVDCVVHLAARAHRGGSDAEFASDVALVQSLARAAAQAGVRRFVQMSSIGVLGTTTRGTPFTEAGVPAPTEPYAIAKLQAEQSLRHELSSTATQSVILRPSMVYGPHAPGNFARLLRTVQRGWPLPFGSIRNRRSLIGIENLLDAIELCMDHPAAADQTFLVADDQAVSTPELVSLIARGLGVNARLWSVPQGLLKVVARAAGRQRMAESLLGDLEIDCSHIQRSLGWRARIDAREGIVQAART